MTISTVNLLRFKLSSAGMNGSWVSEKNTDSLWKTLPMLGLLITMSLSRLSGYAKVC